MWPILWSCLCIGFVLAVAYCAWLSGKRGGLTAERDRFAQALQESQALAESYRGEIRDLDRKLAQADRQLAVAQQTQTHVQQQFDIAQRQLRDTFKSLAGDTLRQSVDQFLQLARKSFEGDQKQATAQLEQRKQAIEQLLKPLGDRLKEYNDSIQEIEKDRKKDKGALAAQIELLGKETSDLVQILRHPAARGRWGQVQLRRVVELANMMPNCDFFEQATVQTSQGRLQPDMIVRLPNDRTIVVDAKAPLDAFDSSLQAQEPDQRSRFLQLHVETVEKHVRQLAAKQYDEQFSRSPEFVVLFIPAESILYAAVRIRPELMESAMKRRVVIATPSVLFALLKAVEMGWREERAAENAQKICDLARQLHERLCVAATHLQKVGGSLEAAVKQYNQFVGSFESRVLVSAKKLEDLRADSPASLPADMGVIQILPREPKQVIDEAASLGD